MSSLTTLNSRIAYAGDGVTSVFSTTFWVQEAADVTVYQRVNSTLVDTLLVLDTDYTMSSLDVFTGANVTLVAGAMASTDTLIIYRTPPEENQSDLTNTGSLFPTSVTRALDYLTALVQNTRLTKPRSLRLPDRFNTEWNDIAIDDDLTSMASLFLSFDTNGQPQITATTNTPVSAFMVPVLNAATAAAAKAILLTDLVNEATPQLGAVLDTNAHGVKWSKGADVASATALPLLADGNEFDVTGTTTVTSIDTLGAGTVVVLHFDGALVLTHHATGLILPSGANITTAAGDIVVMYEYATGDWRCVSYSKADGRPVVTALKVPAERTTTTETLVLSDANSTVRCANAGAIALTVPPNSSTPYPVGTVINITQSGAGTITLTPGSGVTLNSSGALLDTAAQWATASIWKIGTNEWMVAGELA